MKPLQFAEENHYRHSYKFNHVAVCEVVKFRKHFCE